jgi:hypothetical protein
MYWIIYVAILFSISKPFMVLGDRIHVGALQNLSRKLF